MATYSFVNIDLPEAARLADLTGIRNDLRTAREFAVLLKDNYRAKTDDKLRATEALQIAALIRYCRPFGTGVRLKLNPNDLVSLTDQERKAHRRLIDIRDKFVAHSINAFEDSQPIARYCEERVRNEGIISIGVVYAWASSLAPADADTLIGLADKWAEFVDSKIAEEQKKVLGLVRQIPLEELFRRFSARSPQIDHENPHKRRPRLRQGPPTHG